MYKVGCVVPSKNGPNGWMTLRVIACPIRHPSRALPPRRRRRPRLPRDPCGTTTTTIIIRITTIILTIPFESCSNCLPNKKMSLTMAFYRPPLNGMRDNPSPFWYRNSLVLFVAWSHNVVRTIGRLDIASVSHQYSVCPQVLLVFAGLVSRSAQ